jgi:hypothetical protein
MNQGVLRGGEEGIVKVKLFVQDKSPFRRWRRFLTALEDEVNAWLAANPGIKIVHIKQSSNGGSFDTSKVFLSVWYEERTEPVSPVDLSLWSAGAPDEGTAFRGT